MNCATRLLKPQNKLIKMPTIFSKTANRYWPVVSNNLVDSLPGGTFLLSRDPMRGMFLEEINDFELPAKRYAGNDKMAERMLNTFADRKCATGVMLSGEKGSGKSLLAKTLSLLAKKNKIPTVVVNAPWHGEEFNSFIQAIDQPAIVIFDEFEKVYEKEQQEAVLTLLDGMFPSNKMYVFTCNDKYRVDSHMRNRPGRIYYALDYTGIDSDIINEYCADRLKDKTQVESVIKVSQMFKEFNFDMLRALVEEMNRYDETAMQAVKVLNIKPEFDVGAKFIIGYKHETDGMSAHITGEDREWQGNPLTNRIDIGAYYISTKKKPKSEEEIENKGHWRNVIFTIEDLKAMDPNTGKYEFVNRAGGQLTLTRVKSVETRVFDMM